MIKDLVSLANHLDAKGLTKEADALDSIVAKALKKIAGRKLFKRIGDDWDDPSVKIYKDRELNEYIVVPPDSDPYDSDAGYHTDDLSDARGTAKAMWEEYKKKMTPAQKTDMAWKALYYKAGQIHSTPSLHGGIYWNQPEDYYSIEMVSAEVTDSWLKEASNMDEAVLAWYSGNAREYLESKGSPVDERPESRNDDDNLFHALVWVAIEHEMFNYLENKPTSDEMDYRDYEERTFGPPPSEQDYESDLPQREY